MRYIRPDKDKLPGFQWEFRVLCAIQAENPAGTGGDIHDLIAGMCVIYNVVNGMLLRPYISGMVWKLGENSMNRMKEGISLYKEIREEVRDGVPFFPLGFGTLKSEVLAYGVKAEKNTYLSVWTPGTTEAVIPLENAEQVRRVSVIYPKEEMCGYKIENGNLVVKMPQEKAARLFKIEMK